MTYLILYIAGITSIWWIYRVGWIEALKTILSVLIPSILIPHLINKFLGGHNGDSYGAGLVITETTNLLLLSIILVPN